jgi:hypothetical protein
MSRFQFLAKVFALALVIVVSAYPADPGEAREDWISLRITKAGFVVGYTGGGGTLHHRGRSYPVSISGLRVGLTIGASAAELSGPVFYLRHPSDIEGTYSAIQASAALGPGGNAIVLTNELGVRLELEGSQAGIEASLDWGGMVITLE